MRIIAGRFKGRKLVGFQAGHLRPTTDRVKESLFNKLAEAVLGARVLDLFSGTGNLGLEALSRGAEEVVFVDKSGKSLQILDKNIALLGVKNEVQVVREEAFRFMKKWNASPFDLLLVDPPFTQKIAHQVMVSLSQSKLVRIGGRVVIESGHQEWIGDQYPPFNLLDRRHFGDKSVSFFRLLGE